METQILNGKKIRDEILSQIKDEVKKLPFIPVFCDVLVGDDVVSHQYVEMKKQKIESVGMKFLSANFPDSISTEELKKEIKKINKTENICGIIIQLPLPNHIDRRSVLDTVDPSLDVDSLGSVRSKNFYNGDITLGFPTALACYKLLESVFNNPKENLKDKNIVVLGQGDLVGKPVSALLNLKGIKNIPISSDTEDKEIILKNADVIISGIGKPNFLNKENTKSGVVLIDAGTSESNGSITGDADLNSLLSYAGFISPVPGGVGPVTIAILINNVLNVAKTKIK